MAELQTIARPYAKAAFLSAKHSKKDLSQWSINLKALDQLYKLADINNLIAMPKISLAQKSEILIQAIEKVISSSLDSKFKNFIYLLLENGKLSCISAITYAFEAMKAEYESIIYATLISALPVSKSHENAFKAALAKRFNKKIELQVEIDTSLIGGAIVRADGLVIDGSLRGHLSKMQTFLTS